MAGLFRTRMYMYNAFKTYQPIYEKIIVSSATMGTLLGGVTSITNNLLYPGYDSTKSTENIVHDCVHNGMIGGIHGGLLGIASPILIPIYVVNYTISIINYEYKKFIVK